MTLANTTYSFRNFILFTFACVRFSSAIIFHSGIMSDQINLRVVASIVLSSDDEDSHDNDLHNYSLLSESDDDSVIEIVSSDDESLKLPNQDDRMIDAFDMLESNSSLSSADVATTELVAHESLVIDDKTFVVEPLDTSVEIDEFGELLLNCMYGDTVSLCSIAFAEIKLIQHVTFLQWRRSQLIKKCVSTKDKCPSEVRNRDKSHGFSLCELYAATRFGLKMLP